MSVLHPGITVVVVNYKTPWDLAGFCDTYRKFAPADAELVIVNVQPEQDDLDVAEEAAFDQHIVAATNVGYAAACNRAARQTNREIIAFFNADTRLHEDVLETCRTALLENDDWGVVGPRQVDEHNRLTHAGILGTREQPWIRGWWEEDHGQYNEILTNVPSVQGSAYFIKRKVWDQLYQCPVYQYIAPHAEGAFLPTEHFYEETWCSYHAIEHGWKVVYYGPVVMEHHWHKASPVGGLFATRTMRESQLTFRAACSTHGIPCD